MWAVDPDSSGDQLLHQVLCLFISACSLVASLHGASEVLGLDMDVNHARRTLSSNHDALPASCQPRFIEYKFGESIDIIPDFAAKRDSVIFCSDVLYRSTAPEQLLPTIVKLIELKLGARDELCNFSDIVRCNSVTPDSSASLPSFVLTPSHVASYPEPAALPLQPCSTEFSRLLLSICVFLCYPERSADFASDFVRLVERKRIMAPSGAAEIRCLHINMRELQASVVSRFPELFDVGNPNLHIVGLIVCELGKDN